jgi:hypothetical protein
MGSDQHFADPADGRRRGNVDLTPFIAAVCLLVAQPAVAYDANGVALGASEAEIAERFPNAQCRPLEWTTQAAERRCDDAKVQFGGAAARVTFYLKQDAVQAFEVRFDTREAPRVAGFLKERYGRPAAETREPTVRGGRASRELYQVVWRKDGQRAVLTAVMERRRASLTVSYWDFEEEIYRLRGDDFISFLRGDDCRCRARCRRM